MAKETEILARFVQDFSLDQLDGKTMHLVRYCILDTIGSALGAADSKEIRSILKTWQQWSGLGENHRSAWAWGQNCKTNLLTAVLVNGLMCHELELDDVHTASKSHIGAVVIPAAWAVAETIGATGRELTEAVVVGYEVMGRVGMGMDVASNRKRGWHTTGIIGTFGAAAAAARLLHLTIPQTVSALGMAGTQSSGLWAFLAEGSTCKKLHPARAAVNGVCAALLALSGMTGPTHILDAADGGLYQAVSDSFDMHRITSGLGQDFVITRMDKKPYPCCRTTHHAIDAALQLQGKHFFRPEDIAGILVETYDVGVLQCGFEKYPQSPVEAKFSIAFTCAVAFVYGSVTVGAFCQEVLENPQVKRIAKATKVISSDLFTQRYPKRWGSRMTVTTADGRQYVCQIDDMSGSVAVPLSEKQEQDKFRSLAESTLGQSAQPLMEQLLQIERLPALPKI